MSNMHSKNKGQNSPAVPVYWEGTVCVLFWRCTVALHCIYSFSDVAQTEVHCSHYCCVRKFTVMAFAQSKPRQGLNKTGPPSSRNCPAGII